MPKASEEHSVSGVPQLGLDVVDGAVRTMGQVAPWSGLCPRSAIRPPAAATEITPQPAVDEMISGWMRRPETSPMRGG